MSYTSSEVARTVERIRIGSRQSGRFEKKAPFRNPKGCEF
jgi:hypothetical protein